MTTQSQRKLKLALKRKAQPLLRKTKGVKYPSYNKVNMNRRRK